MSHISEQLTPLYLDIDNTILNTAEVFIKKYCEENNIIPNIISEDKLKLVLQLGIAELNKRDLESKGDE